MFDWNDEELTDIIWGEAGEGEDHIVPYSDGDLEKPPDLYGYHFKKEHNQEDLDIKPTEQKKPVRESDLLGVKLECGSQYDTNDGLNTTECSIESWPNLSLQSATETEQDTIVNEASIDATGIPKQDLRSDKTAPLDNASKIFQSPLEDSEQGDFVDYGWATVGSFEDLDRILSNDDPLFGHASLGNADELWSSSKNVTSSPEKSIPLSVDCSNLGLGPLWSTSEPYEVKAEYLSDQSMSFTPAYEKLDLYPSSASQDNKSCVENVNFSGGKSKNTLKEKAALEMAGNTPMLKSPLDVVSLAANNEYIEKGNRQKKSLKGRKKLEGKSEVRNLQDLRGTWVQTENHFFQYDSQYGPVVGQPSSSLVFSQHTQLQGPESSQYKNFASPLTPYMHANVVKPYTPPMHVLSQYCSQHSVPSTYEVSLGNPNSLKKSAETPMKSLTMTPQEKIEKLRRQQQMRAMLAIQKQQKQFGNRVSCTDYSVMEGENIEAEENPYTLPSRDLNSPIEQDDSNTVSSGLDDCSVQDSILYQLQEIIAKLDFQIRLCIRDSLFRLAESAKKRQYAGDTSSSNNSNRDKVLKEEAKDSHNRFSKASDVETETNPIDRTVAHLLFHRPLEMSGKLVETPESPLLTNLLPYERKATSSMSFPTKFMPQRAENTQFVNHEESNVPCVFPDGDPLKISPCLDASEDASTNGGIVDGTTLKIEASQ